MRKKILVMAALPLLLAFIGGCGGSGHTTPPPSQNVPVVVSLTSQPPAAGETLPAGVNLISTQVSITGACLLTASDTSTTTCTTGQSILPTGAAVQFSNLQSPSQPDVVASANVTANTYTGVLVTFGSPVALTVSVDPGDSYTDGTTTCDNTAGATPLICQINPVSAASATFTFPAPITLTAGTPVQIAIGLDLTGSLVSSGNAAPFTLSVTPVISASENTTAGADGNLVDVGNVTGTVSAVSATSITINDGATGLPLLLNVGANTTVTNYAMNGTTCTTANTIACVQVGDVVTLGYGASATSPVSFTATNLAGNPGITTANSFQGTIVATTPADEVVVTAIPGGNANGLAVGQVLDLTFAAGAVFSNSSGVALPGTFAAATDLVVGQNVLVDISCPSVGGVITCSYIPPVVGPPPVIGSVAADAIELLPSQVLGPVSALASPNFTVSPLNSFYTGNGVTSVAAQTGAFTTYTGTVSGGFTSLTVGTPYLYSGYLLNSGTPAAPVFYDTNIYGNQ